MRRAFPLALRTREADAPSGGARLAERWRIVQQLPGGERLNVDLIARRSFAAPTSLPELVALKAAEHQGEAIFNHYYERLQEAYFIQARDIGDASILEELAQGIVPDMHRYRRDVESGALEGEVMVDYQVARARGVRGTPSIIPGERDRVLYLLGHPIPLEAYRAAVEALLVERAAAAGR